MPMSGSLTRAKLYKIINMKNNNDVYIGHTTMLYLSERMAGHRRQVKYGRDNRNGYRSPAEQYMFEVGIENFKIFLIPKDVSFVKSRKELEEIEYRTMKEFKEQGYNVLNFYQSNEDVRKKLSEVRKEEYENGKKPANFNYGYVYKENGKWHFGWSENGKSKDKSFAESKWGAEKAEKLANAMRFKIYPELEDKDNLKQLLADELNPKFLERNGNFKYGELQRYEFHSGKWSWVFRWSIGNGKFKSKSYSENKYGAEKAKQLAEEMRLEIYPELKNNNTNSD